MTPELLGDGVYAGSVDEIVREAGFSKGAFYGAQGDTNGPSTSPDYKAPTENVLMLVPFYSAEKACEAVSAIFRSGVIPSALEFMERDCIEYVMRFVDVKVPLKVRPVLPGHRMLE